MKTLIGRTAVITGGASGIGLALARAFAAEKMNVVLADIEQAALDHAVDDLRRLGTAVIGVRADVSQRAQVQALADAAVKAFGGVHVVCNNAGVESGSLFGNISRATWDWVLQVDLFGVIYGCQIFLPLLRQQDEGHIINTGSMASLTANMITGSPYTTAKFAILGLTENLFHELRGAGEQIGVSALLPGMVNTNMPFSERNRPEGVPDTDDDPARAAIRDFTQNGGAGGLEPEVVADLVLAAIREDRFYVLPHEQDARTVMRERIAWMQRDISTDEGINGSVGRSTTRG
jgi:NAD(P)-dependent dehydrogenase (short-subunit alcohol dehydrogenase family)